MEKDTEVDRAEAAKAADLAQRLLDGLNEVKKEVTPPHEAGWLERVERLLAAAKAAIDEVVPYPYKSSVDTGFSREWTRMVLDRETDMLADFAIAASLYAMGQGKTPDIRRAMLLAGITVNDLLCAARLSLEHQRPRYVDDDGNADPAVGA